MNWPNRITVFRLMTVPIVITLIICGYYFKADKYSIINGNYHLSIFYLMAGIVFILGSLSDFLDGYLARKYNQVTDFGKFFDPIADKLLVNSVLILFAWTQMLPVWVTLILILRDTFVDLVRMMLSKKGQTLAADIWGKLKTVFQMVGLSILFFVSYKLFNGKMQGEYGWYNQVILIPMYLATIFSLYSGVNYFIQAYPIIFKNKQANNV